MKFLLKNNIFMNVIFVIIIIVIIIFAIISSIINKKTQKLEQQKQKKQIINKIKQYIRNINNQKNIRIEYIKIIARKGKEYKYRDIFDIIVDIYEAKNNKWLEQKAFEIESISKKIDRKNYEIIWIVNQEIDLEKTKYRIDILEKKIKLTKKEKQIEKKRIKMDLKKQHLEQIEKDKKYKQNNVVFNDTKYKFKVKKFVPKKIN